MKKFFTKIIFSICIFFSATTVAQITYSSTFETGLGDWSYESGNDFNWIRKSGGTPSGNTGPSSAIQGIYYIYVEASVPNYPSKTAGITSKSYEIGSNGTFNFNYHMYGVHMGTITLLASKNGGSWQSIWTLSGNKGNSWQTAQVDLSSFVGSNVKFKFYAVTGSNYAGDIAIDNIQISSGSVSMGPSTSLSNSENYIYTVNPRIPVQDISHINFNDNKIEAVQYFDGLGRAKQSIGIRAGGGREDIITHVEYDELGRQTKEYLPYANIVGNSGGFRAGDIATITNQYYQTKYPEDFNGVSLPDVNAYSQKTLENSPLSRVLEQGAPGKDWKIGDTFAAEGYSNNSHTVKIEYDTNTLSEVKSYWVNTTFANNTYTPTLQGGSDIDFYNPGELLKTITKDENWLAGQPHIKDHTTEEFKNKQGQVVLKRTYGASEINNTLQQSVAHDTYYIYDDYGNLTYVLPPKAEGNTAKPDTTELDELCYQYKYDHKNRLIEKKIPGKDWEYIVYNRIDQPILTQDKIQRNKTQKEWLATKYDAFGRVVYTSLVIDNQSRSAMQGHARNSYYTNIEKRTTTSRTLDGAAIFYSGTTLKGNNTGTKELLTINYYDSYSNVLPSGYVGPTSVLNQPVSTNVKGLPTLSKVRVLDTNDWITTITYYDHKSRPIYVYSKNDYLNTIDIIESRLDDFTGKVLETKTTHIKSSNTPIVTIDRFYYDHSDRLKKHTQNINNASLDEVILENTYDDLGQLTSKRVGGKTNDADGLQIVDYKYNIRGWLKKINNIEVLGNDLFSFKLNYNSTDINGSIPLYNGNISETISFTQNDILNFSNVKSRGYSYKYDALNRITSADFKVENTSGTYQFLNGGNHLLNSVVYDKNGNIKTLKRTGGGTFYNSLVDDLVYTYNSGNKLLKVQDNATSFDNMKDDGFKDGTNSGNDYTYDANGNMTRDNNKDISIHYNHLNLPTEVPFWSQDAQISYKYDARGVKLKKTLASMNEGTTTTEYAGNYIYENNNLQFFNHPEGYVKLDNGIYNYVYQYKDHLGNVRLSYADSNNNGAISPSTEIIEESNYYPFGLKHKGYNNVTSSNGNSVAQKKGFGGKEFNDELGLQWHDFGARNYDASLGRWMNLDPMADRNYTRTPYRYGYNNPIKFVDPDGKYERDGHYWTVYLAATLVGHQSPASIAYWAEEPDHIMSHSGDIIRSTDTWMNPDMQISTHSLTGERAGAARARARNRYSNLKSLGAGIDKLGNALHTLGDSYSHTNMFGSMYSAPLGHLFRGHTPDKIAKRPGLYLEYVKDLVNTLGGADVDMFAFDYIAENKGGTEENSAILETEIRIREGVGTFSVGGNQGKSIKRYVSARNKKYKKQYKAVTAKVDVYTRNDDGEWEKSEQTKTFLTSN